MEPYEAWDRYCAEQEKREQAWKEEIAELRCLSFPLRCGQCFNYCNYEHRDMNGFRCDGVCVSTSDDMPVHIDGVDKDTEACWKFEPMEGA